MCQLLSWFFIASSDIRASEAAPGFRKTQALSKIAESQIHQLELQQRVHRMQSPHCCLPSPKPLASCRRFLLEWLSYLHRYIPVGLLDVVPQKLHWRAPAYVGRSDLETLLSSDSAADWVRISEILLGPAPPSFSFTPKHKSNAYSTNASQLQAEAEGEENG